MPIKIKNSNDVHTNGIKVIVYGKAGVGKTVLCSTAPKPIIISAEKGLLSLVGKNIPYIEVKSIADIQEAFDYTKNNAAYETICLDSISEIAEVVLAELKKTTPDGRQAYMKLAEAMNPMMRNFRDIQKNVVFTAKMRVREDEMTNVSYREPMMPGQVLPNNIPYLFDEVFYMDMDKKGERKLITEAGISHIAKDRSGKLDKSEVPNLLMIFDKIIK